MTRSLTEIRADVEAQHEGCCCKDRAQLLALVDELGALLREITPCTRDILWCALVWNDHNFDYGTLLNKAARAAKSMGIDRFNGVDAVNFWMERVDAALAKLHEQGSAE